MANNRDVELKIRAVDNASKAIESVADALKALEDAGAIGGDGLKKLSNALRVLENEDKRLAASTDTVTRALEKQRAATTAATENIERRKIEVAELTAQLKLLQAENQRAFIGPRRDGLSEQIRNIRASISQANKDIRASTTLYEANTAGILKSEASLEVLRDTQDRTAQSIARTTAQIELQTKAQQRNNAELGRRAQAAAAQQFFNNRFAPGLNQPRNTIEQQREIASVLRVADARNREQEARAAAAAAKIEAEALARLRAQINPVAEAEARVRVEVQRLIQFRRQGKITLDEARQALALYRAELVKVRETERAASGGIDSRGRPTILGLKPYELQNLGFQVNDVITQLASGTSLSQTLAQQLGQIIQIIPGIGEGIVAFIRSPMLLAGAAITGVLIAGLVRASNEAQRLRDVGAIITSIGNAASLSAGELNKSAAELDQLGLSAEDAIRAIRTFTRAGLNPDRFVQFGLAARDMALVLGKDVPESAKLLVDGLTGGFEAVQRLQEETGVYTDAELERIRVLFESGRAEDARRLAVEAATESYAEAAAAARGPWANAALTFERAWTKLISAIANSVVVSGTVRLFGDLADGLATLITKAEQFTTTDFFRWLSRGIPGGASVLGAGAEGVQAGLPRPGAAPTVASDAEVRRRSEGANARLARETQVAILADTEVRTQEILEQKLQEFRRRTRAEIQNDDRFRGASEDRINLAVEARAARERIKLTEQLARFQEQQANAAERSKRAAEEAAKKAREPVEAQNDLNARLDADIERRQRIAESERAKFGLVGEALIQEERRQAILEAVRVEEERVAELNRQRIRVGLDALGIDEERLRKLRESAAAEFDARNARRVADEGRRLVDQPVEELSALRDSINQQITQLQQQGQIGAANALQDQLTDVNTQLQVAIENARIFYDSIRGREAEFGLTEAAIDQIILKLQTAQEQSRQWAMVLGISGQQIAEIVSRQAANAFDQFAQAVANGENAFESLGRAFLQFAADFLRQIAQMIIQQQIFNLVSGLLRSIGSIGGSNSASFIARNARSGISVAHTGGVIGKGGLRVRPGVDLSLFANAARYHTGGIAGLNPNEVPAILERGEEVLTADDPRHMANGGGSRSVTVINALDASDVVSKALNTRPGEQALLNFIRVNSGAVKAAMG